MFDPDALHYNRAAIRRLLEAAFRDAGELRRFCKEHPRLSSVAKSLPDNPSLDDVTEKLIDYCVTQVEVQELLSAVRNLNPAQLERFENGDFGPPVLSSGPVTPPATPESTVSPAIPSVPTTGEVLPGGQPHKSPTWLVLSLNLALVLLPSLVDRACSTPGVCS